jgi:hypothetical protein
MFSDPSNYGKPHVAGLGRYEGRPRLGCRFCGCWLLKVNQELVAVGIDDLVRADWP